MDCDYMLGFIRWHAKWNHSIERLFLNTKKIVHHYLSSIDSVKGWVNTSPQENLKLLGSFATNDITEQAFGKITNMYETFNMILGINAAGVSQARTNGDWDHEICGSKMMEAFINLVITCKNL